MEKLDAIMFRRELIDWRDRWVANIPLHLERELLVLFAELDKKIEHMGIKDIFSVESYAEKQLQPIILRWIENEARYLVTSSQRELNCISDHIIEHEKSNQQFSYSDSVSSYVDVAATTATAGAALIAIPGVIALSTTSAGGVLGFIGLTTISWPIALAGIGLVGGVLALSGSKALNLKSKAADKIRNQLRDMLTDRVLVGSQSPSISQQLQQSIVKSAGSYLTELGHVL